MLLCPQKIRELFPLPQKQRNSPVLLRGEASREAVAFFVKREFLWPISDVGWSRNEGRLFKLGSPAVLR